MIEEYQVAELKQEALEGIVEAQMGLGALYYQDENYEEALKWYEMAANQGYVDGKIAVALLCMEPKGEIKPNFLKAALLLEECRRLGDKDAEEMIKKSGTMLAMMALKFGSRDAFERAVSIALESEDPEKTLQNLSREINKKKQEKEKDNKRIDSVTLQQDGRQKKETKDYIIERDTGIRSAGFSYQTKLQMQQAEIMKEMEKYSHKSTLATMILCLCLMHRLTNGKILTGLLQIATIGGFFVWMMYDLMMIGSGKFTDGNGRYINSEKAMSLQREMKALEENYKSGEQQYYARKEAAEELKRLEYVQCCEELGYVDIEGGI